MKSASHFAALVFLVMAASGLWSAQGAQAQARVELRDVDALVYFGEQIIFIATIQSSIPIEDVSIVISEESQGMTYVEPVHVPADGRTEFRFDTKQNRLRPFSTLKWNYRFTFTDGSSAESETFVVRYLDDRFHWQMLEAEPLKVRWYHGDADFGQAALEAARAGLESIAKLMSPDLTRPVEIFIYANEQDLRATLAVGAGDPIAGHADPALGVVMVVVEPGAEQGILMEQRIPHELMHVMTYRYTGAGYPNLPVWLREGLATLAEVYPNPDYERALADALTDNRLLPLRELCESFPAGAGQRFLAYAQSRSFVRYLHDTYGSTGLLSLAETYADGVDCERGPERALSVSLSTLERDWRLVFLGQNPLMPVLQGIAPYLALLCLILIVPLIGIASTLRKKGNRNGRETYVRKR